MKRRKWQPDEKLAIVMDGLKDKKRTPKHISHKMKEEDESRIEELRKRHPSWGARRLKERDKVTGSYILLLSFYRLHY